MRTIIYFIWTLIMLSVLTSCTNALYFYETDKISLTVEARPDSSQPVQGNLGLKQRLALITPPINSNDGDGKDEGEGGEAVSAIASFRFKKDPGGIFDLGAVTIKTGFITGEAAAELDENTVGAATAIVGANTLSNSGANISIMRNIISLIKKDKSNVKAEKILSQLNTLGNFIIPENYPVTLYKAQLVSSSSFSDLQTSFNKNAATALSGDIDGVLTYWGQLNSSVITLNDVLKTPQNYRFNGQVPNDPLIISGLNEVLSTTENETLRVRQELVGNPIYSQTIQYYIDNHL